MVLSQGSLSGANGSDSALIPLATLAWGIDNNLSQRQRLSLQHPIQIATAKAAGASLPMLLLALVLKHPFPPLTVIAALFGIGALGYGISIWLDLLALRDLGAAREAVLFSTAPFVGAAFSLVVLQEAVNPQLMVAGGLMAAGVVLLLREQHSHWHRHEALRHAHRHEPIGSDAHHEHPHAPKDVEGIASDQPFWHAHEHRHGELEHAHPHVSDAHHRHRH